MGSIHASTAAIPLSAVFAQANVQQTGQNPITEIPAASLIPNSKAKRSVCAHSNNNNEMSARLFECINKNQPLVSFHSERGFLQCKHLFNSDKHPKPLQDSRHPSLLQQCLQANKDQRELTIQHEGKEYTVTAVINDIDDNSQEERVKRISAGIRLQSLTNPDDRFEIQLIEFYPKFDGYALNSDMLLKCHTQLSEFREHHQLENNLTGQFSSAKGICRSASLLVLDQFHEWCNTPNNQIDVNDEPAFRTLVMQFIINARGKKSALIPDHKHRSQVDELVQACRVMYNNVHPETKTSSPLQAAKPISESDGEFPSDEENSQHAVSHRIEMDEDQMPELEEIADYRIYEEEFDDTAIWQEVTAVGMESVQEGTVEGVAGLSEPEPLEFDENFWGWNKTAEQLEKMTENPLGKTDEEIKGKIEELKKAVDWLERIFTGKDRASSWLTIEKIKDFLLFLSACSVNRNNVEYSKTLIGYSAQITLNAFTYFLNQNTKMSANSETV